MSSLTINNMPICGVVGDGSMTISYQDCWDIYRRRFESDGPVTVIRELAQWRVNGHIIHPKAWFLEL
jgi:hypothetical protein